MTDSIYTRQIDRGTKIAFGFFFGTTALLGLTCLFDLLTVSPDATTEADRRLAAQILYPVVAVLIVAVAIVVFRSAAVSFLRTPRTILAVIAGSVVSAAGIAIVWKLGGTSAASLDAASGSPRTTYLLSGVPVYVCFASPLLVAALAGRGARAGAVVASWTLTVLCACAWLSGAMQQV